MTVTTSTADSARGVPNTSMPAAQQCQQTLCIAPGVSIEPDALFKTLNLHANAIRTALEGQLSLEAQVRDLRERLAEVVRATPKRPATASPLKVAIERREPEDGKPLIYFFHIPKTSGASFNRFLVDTFGQANVSPQMPWDTLPEHSDSAGNWKVWCGHFGGLVPLLLRSWPRMATILRDPVDRTLSQINHVRRDAQHP